MVTVSSDCNVGVDVYGRHDAVLQDFLSCRTLRSAKRSVRWRSAVWFGATPLSAAVFFVSVIITMITYAFC